ncbi:MAG: class I SAM-dependent methyltransferase [Acidobacteria bacterium]|nr:class I SAM-dependent methyltransferase [Acidobacteriota bacterium]
MHLYESIGHGYGAVRRPDPRIGAVIDGALGSAERVVNVGAGSGSYEPEHRRVVAVEPAWTMVRQRSAGAAPVVRATGTRLPFADRSFDASLAILTLHHWPDVEGGLAELTRVARDRVVILTWDPGFAGFWLTGYFPEILTIDRRIFPAIDLLRGGLGPIATRPVPVPADCTDGFLGAYWRRPEAYLDPAVRAAISTFSKLRDVEPILARLARDLETGAWNERHGHLLALDELDLGYRLVVTR